MRARQSNEPVSFDCLGNAPTRQQIVYCFILAGDYEPQGGYGKIQFAIAEAGSLHTTPADTLTRSSGGAEKGKKVPKKK